MNFLCNTSRQRANYKFPAAVLQSFDCWRDRWFLTSSFAFRRGSARTRLRNAVIAEARETTTVSVRSLH